MPYTGRQCLTSLLRDMNWLQFGEMVAVEVDDCEVVDETLSSAQRKFVELVKDGNQFFELIKVHQGDPNYAVTPECTPSGFRARRFHKFN